MVPVLTGINYPQYEKSLKIDEVVGGEFTDIMFEGSKIDPITFKIALIMSLERSRIFQIIKSNESADYILKTVLLRQDQPIAGFDMKVTLMVKYYLLDSITQHEVWSKDILSSYTQNFSSSCIGADRLNKANEGVVRENIKILLDELSNLSLK
jgi:hypothetical protein